MIIELRTPLMLATAPVQIDLPQVKYDHTSQQSIQLSENKNQTSYTYGTASGYLPSGKPSDQDTD